MKLGFIKNSLRGVSYRSFHRTLLPLLFLALVFSLSRPASSQTVTAEINGTVTDPTNAPIQGASVVATDVDRGTSFSGTTMSNGTYKLPPLPVGTYTVKVTAPGFETEVLPPVTLVLNQIAGLNFKMTVGKVNQIVSVTSQAPLLQTQSTEVSTIVDAKTNVSLPLASRNYLQLTLLAPGSVSPNPTSMYNAQNIQGAGRPYINGNRKEANNYLLDGMENTQQSDNLVAFSPAPDAIEEFNLITQNAPAEFGSYEGGIVSVSVKSGTNHYHGDLWEFFRNDALNADNWGNKLQNARAGKIVAPKAGLRWNMFGGTVGGPILKNKLFFFVDYQGQRFHTIGASSFYNAYTAPERAGDFGQLCTDPQEGGGFDQFGNCTAVAKHGIQVKDPFTGANVPYNNLANYIASNVDPQLTAYYNSGGGKVFQNIVNSTYYPSVSSLGAGSGTAANPGIFNNVAYQNVNPLNVDQGDFKADWAASPKDHIFGRYSREQLLNDTNTNLQVIAVVQESNTIWNAVGDWTHIFNPNVLNDVRAGVDWVQLIDVNAAYTPPDFGATVGIAGATALPNLGPSPASGIGSNGQVLKWSDTVIQAEDHLNITKGHHSMDVGFQIFRDRLDTFFSGGGGPYGSYGFNGVFTGAGDTDFYLGMVQNEGQYFTNAAPGVEPAWGQRTSTMGGYFQDNWRPTDNLTLNLGLRYQANTPLTEVHGRQVNYDPISGQPYYPAGHPLPSNVTFPGLQPIADSNQALYNGYYGPANFEPRLGFAYTPGNGGKTVIRGAYSVSDYLEGTGNALRTTQNIPFNVTVAVQNNCTGAGQPGCNPLQFQLNNGIVPVLGNQFAGAKINIWDPHLRPALAHQWNLSVQQVIAKNTTVQVAYIGQLGTHLVVPLSLLQKQLNANGTLSPSPYLAGNPGLLAQIGRAVNSASVGRQSYNALQAVVDKHLSNGLEGQVAYTYSHCLTNNTGYYGDSGQVAPASAYWQNIYNPQAEWGSCFFDVTHALTAYAVYAIPYGRGKTHGGDLNPIVNAVLGNWSVSPIYTLHGGFALTLGGGDHTGTGALSARPDCNGDPHYPKTRTSNGIQWFDPTVYTQAQTGTFGNCGPGTVRGPGYDAVDVSLQKTFPIHNATQLEFRSEFINALNHPIFNAPGTGCAGSSPGSSCAGGSMGLIAGSQGERNIQFALKLYY